MKLSDAQAMLTRLQELAGEWAESGFLCIEDGSGITVPVEELSIVWSREGLDETGEDLQIGASVTLPSNWMYTRKLLEGLNVTRNPTPAEVDAAVRKVMEG